MTPTGSSGASPRVGGMLLLFAVFAILGGPLVFVIWETINQVLTGDFGAIRLEWFLPAVIAFGVLLFVLGRVLRRWSAGA
jgi:hypothetical protein